MNLVVYSTIFGETDWLKEPRSPGNIRFVMFTDKDLTSKHWEIVRIPPPERPKRACRSYKQLSHKVFPDADVSLWVDAAFELLVDPRDLVALHQGEFTAFRHHKRNRITDEAPAIIRAGKGKADAIYAQLAAYKKAGWDTDENPQKVLTNGGFLLRRHTPRVVAFNELWHEEVQTRTLRDQMSVDYCAARVGLPIDYFPGNVAANPYVRRYSCPKPTSDF